MSTGLCVITVLILVCAVVLTHLTRRELKRAESPRKGLVALGVMWLAVVIYLALVIRS